MADFMVDQQEFKYGVLWFGACFPRRTNSTPTTRWIPFGLDTQPVSKIEFNKAHWYVLVKSEYSIFKILIFLSFAPFSVAQQNRIQRLCSMLGDHIVSSQHRYRQSADYRIRCKTLRGSTLFLYELVYHCRC